MKVAVWLLTTVFASTVVAQQGAQTAATSKVEARSPSKEVTDAILGDIAKGGKEGDPIVDRRRKALEEAAKAQMTPEEIRRYREVMQGRERARAGLYAQDLAGIERSVQINPGASKKDTRRAEEIRISAATTTTLVFTDDAGNPWKVVEAFAPADLAVPKRNGHLLTLLPSENGVAFGRGNLTVILEGLGVLVFGVSSGLSTELDYTVNVQVTGKNPSAPVTALRTGTTIENDPDFPLFLDGIPPDSARTLRTSQRETEAWSYRGAVYVKTKLALHSPAFQLSAGSATGTVVYRFASNPGIVNAIHEGRVISIAIGE